MARRRRKGRKGRRRGREPRKVAKQTVPRTLRGAAKMARGHFGVARLHPEQRQAIEGLLENRDVLVVLPTGFGKSLIYQATAMVLDRPALVISPLIALMRDQETSLHKKRIPAVRLDSTLGVRARRHALDRIRKGGRLIILTTPETAASEEGQAALKEAAPELMCVDEAHCVSEWGHDFRPAYLRLGAVRRELGIDRMLTLTATATPEVQRDIARRLSMTDPLTIVAPPFRKNLVLEAVSVPGNLKHERAGELLRQLKRPGIVYCSTTKAVDQVFAALRRARIPCARYHGKMKKAERDAAQRRFARRNNAVVMVATNAFGMGIDKADIRYVMHFQVPGSLEEYVQQAGRAGRDGKRSRCILLFDEADLKIQEHLQKKSRANASQVRRVTAAIEAWVDEERDFSPKEIALSAGVPTTAARAACAELEQLGLLRRGSDRRLRATADAVTLRDSALQLSQSLETRRRQDARRLRAIRSYVESEDCRSRFIRQWFGDDDPPRCGKCDRCRAQQKRSR